MNQGSEPCRQRPEKSGIGPPCASASARPGAGWATTAAHDVAHNVAHNAARIVARTAARKGKFRRTFMSTSRHELLAQPTLVRCGPKLILSQAPDRRTPGDTPGAPRPAPNSRRLYRPMFFLKLGSLPRRVPWSWLDHRPRFPKASGYTR